MMYEPQEDSFLIQTFVKKHAHGSVLDMGTGTGILAKTAAQSRKVQKVLGVDINEAAITYCRNTIKSNTKTNKKISFAVSDLFSNVKGRFDTIIFNPPYLPKEAGEEPHLARMLSGGEKGYELIASFLSQVSTHLKPQGNIILLFSSLTNKGIVDKLIEENAFDYGELGTQKFFMETLYCYAITRNALLQHLQHRGLNNIEFLARGKRGIVYTALYKKKKVAVKIRHPQSSARKRLENEAAWLKKLNKYSIGPKLLFAGKNFIVYEFVEGTFFPKYIESHSSASIKKVIANVFNQCFTMDKLGMTKEEMHHPPKHIIVNNISVKQSTKPAATLIDFERAHKSMKPKNVTQFAQYLCSIERQLVAAGLLFNSLAVRRKAQEYKRFPDEAHLQHIINEFQ